MPTRRQLRVSDQLREVISELIRLEVDDPRLEGVTIMDVVIDRELEIANVYVNALSGEDARKDVMRALDGATRLLRKGMGRRVRLRKTPELRFHWDESLAQADKIEALLASIRVPSSEEANENADERD